MKILISLTFFVGLCSLALANEFESPVTTLQKSSSTLEVVNGDSKLPLWQALASAMQHEEKERLQVSYECIPNIGNATTSLEKCKVVIGKRLLANFLNQCGEFSKGAYHFHFVRAKLVNANYEIRGDIDLQISRR